MRYKSGSSFRRALEDRLRSISLETGAPLVRLRKMVVFERFLARLLEHQPDKWILKGGYSLQLRLGNRARTTKDIDVFTKVQKEKIQSSLRDAGSLNLEDWFEFEVSKSTRSIAVGFGGERYHIRALLDGRTFDQFIIDVGLDDLMLGDIEHLITPPLLAFAGFQPTVLPCYSIVQQIAEKFHAYTRPRSTGESTRVKDLVDILILASIDRIDAKELLTALRGTFDSSKTHRMPMDFPDPPAAWVRSYRRMADEVGLGFTTLEEGSHAAKVFLNPILMGEAKGSWNPADWSWQKNRGI